MWNSINAYSQCHKSVYVIILTVESCKSKVKCLCGKVDYTIKLKYFEDELSVRTNYYMITIRKWDECSIVLRPCPGHGFMYPLKIGSKLSITARYIELLVSARKALKRRKNVDDLSERNSSPLLCQNMKLKITISVSKKGLKCRKNDKNLLKNVIDRYSKIIWLW